jgi:hypothetical protein
VTRRKAPVPSVDLIEALRLHEERKKREALERVVAVRLKAHWSNIEKVSRNLDEARVFKKVCDRAEFVNFMVDRDLTFAMPGKIALQLKRLSQKMKSMIKAISETDPHLQEMLVDLSRELAKGREKFDNLLPIFAKQITKKAPKDLRDQHRKKMIVGLSTSLLEEVEPKPTKKDVLLLARSLFNVAFAYDPGDMRQL